MATRTLKPRTPATLLVRGGDACTLSIARDSVAHWRLRLIAHTADGAHEAGCIYTSPSAVTGAPRSRVIAAACLPGVGAWSVEADCLAEDFGIEGLPLEIDLAVALTHGLPAWTDREQRLTHVQSSGPSANVSIALAPWERPLALVVRAAAVAATYRFGTTEPVNTVQPGEAIALEFGGRGWGQVITLTNVGSYMLQYEG